MHRSISRIVQLLVLVSTVTACSTPPRLINEYKIDVQQGNVLSQDMVNQLKPGMTRDQVRFVLGTPMLTDVFHQNRWDYVYRFRNGRTEQVQSRRLSVFFGGDGLLSRVEGDVAGASEQELAVPQARTRLLDLGGAQDGAAHEDQPGFFRRVLNTIGL